MSAETPDPLLNGVLGEHQVLFTLLVLAMLAVLFRLRGFKEAIGLAAAAQRTASPARCLKDQGSERAGAALYAWIPLSRSKSAHEGD